jgi:hypothetical protein
MAFGFRASKSAQQMSVLGQILPVDGDMRLIILVSEVIIDDRLRDAFGAGRAPCVQ